MSLMFFTVDDIYRNKNDLHIMDYFYTLEKAFIFCL